MLSYEYIGGGMDNRVFVGRRVVGEVVDGVFVKYVVASKHFLRTPPAISFDVTTLIQAQLLGAESIRVIDTESGIEYSATIAKVLERGIRIDRGFGLQAALMLEEWDKANNVEE